MNEYRRRFVAFTMALIGIVLLIVFTLIGVMMHRAAINELENTMRLVIEPWNEQFAGFKPWDGRHPFPQDGAQDQPLPTDGAQDQPLPTDEAQTPAPFDPGADRPEPRDKGKRQFSTEGVETVFYNLETDELTLLSSTVKENIEHVEEAVREIVKQEKSYGTLSKYHLIYRYECINGADYKIALADTSFILSRTAKNALLLFGVFAAAMVIFFFVSRHLSKIAVKPMEEALEMERQFVADLSHDLKTPVTVVLANNSILRANSDSTVGEQLQWVDSTDSAAKNMMALVGSMLELSSLESVKKPQKQPVELSQAAEKCILQLESLAYDKGVALEADIPENITVLGEAASIEQIINGLIENAVKYEPEGGRVDISLVKTRKKARFTVHNHGSFISEADLPHIFERFYRGDKARSEGGHGLGLPILKKRAELIGADIEVHSARGEGTRFTAVFDIA